MCALHASWRPVTARTTVGHVRANAAIPLESAAIVTTMSIVRPSGRPRARRGAKAEPKIWITPVNDRARPIVTASSRYSSRRTNSRRVFIPWLPRLLMNMRTNSARRTVLRQMKVKPSPTSVFTLSRPSSSPAWNICDRSEVDVVERRHAQEDGERRHVEQRGQPERVRGSVRAAERERADGESAEAWADDAGHAVGGEVRRVRRGELVGLDERGDDTEVRRDPPDHLERAEDERDAVEEAEGEEAEVDGDRDEGRPDHAEDRGDAQEAPLLGPIDEGSGERAEEHVGDRLDDAKDRRRADVVRQVQDEERQRETHDLVADGSRGDRRGEEREPLVAQRPGSHGATIGTNDSRRLPLRSQRRALPDG